MRNSRQLNSDFCIRFKIGPHTIYSEPFKLVSSCSQLPPELRDVVRPTKKSGQGPVLPTGMYGQEDKISSPSDKSETKPSSPQTPPSPSEADHLRLQLNELITKGDSEGAAKLASVLAKLIRSSPSVESKSDASEEK
jgi:hypothetical protein